MLSLDWLSVVVSDDRQEIISYLVTRLSEALGIEFESAGGLHGYDCSQRASGCVLAYGGENQRKTLLLSLSGEATSCLGWYGASALCRAVIKRFDVALKFSRIDLALDVPGESWQRWDSVERVRERLQDGRISSITIVNNYQRPDNSIEHDKDCRWSVVGHTTYIGSRTSERFMRIYRKEKVNQGWVTRYEYELKERYASIVGSMLLTGEGIGTAYIFANTNHLDISDIYDLSQVYEEKCQSLPKKKKGRTLKWLLAISCALVEFIESEPELWGDVLSVGKQRLSPAGNTGVHIPEWLNDIDQQALNLETFGMVYHPIVAMQR